MNVSKKASWAPNEYVAKTLIKCAQHQQPKQSVFQSPWWCHTLTLKPMYDVSLDVFVWFSRPHHLLVFINLRKRLTHYFKTSLTSPKCNGFDVIETSLPRFCARRLRNVFRTKNGSLGINDRPDERPDKPSPVLSPWNSVGGAQTSAFIIVVLYVTLDALWPDWPNSNAISAFIALEKYLLYRS